MQPQVMVTRQLSSQQQPTQLHSIPREAVVGREDTMDTAAMEREQKTDKVGEKTEGGVSAVQQGSIQSSAGLVTVPKETAVTDVPSELDSSGHAAGPNATKEEEEAVSMEDDKQKARESCELPVQEVVSVQHSNQDQMEAESGALFQPPRPPPRRVSLLEYKERMKGKKKQPMAAEELLELADSESKAHETEEQKAFPPEQSSEMGLAAGESGASMEEKEDGKKYDSPQEVEMKDAQEPIEEDAAVAKSSGEVMALASHTLKSVVDSKPQEDRSESSAQVSEEYITSSSSAKMAATLSVDTEGSIEWPDDTGVMRDPVDEKTAQAAAANEKEEEEEKRDTAVSESETEKEAKGGGHIEQENTSEQEEETERKREKTRELDKDWRLRRERERKLEREKRRKVGKPIESWRPSLSHSDSLVINPPHFVAGQMFNIPIRTAPPFHRHPHPLALPPQPPPPPPQPFLGFPPPPPPHAFHQPPPPAPTTPSFTPHPQTDMWSMFGSLFGPHGLFPPEEPPQPSVRSPSPTRPLLNLAGAHRSPSPPPKTPPMSPRVRKSRSPNPPPFPPPAKLGGGSISPTASSSSTKPLGEPKPLDAKQFKIIRELIKKTAVHKCDVSVQAVPPRMISEGTQDGRGFKLRSRAVQASVRLQDRSTLTEGGRAEVQHR